MMSTEHPPREVGANLLLGPLPEAAMKGGPGQMTRRDHYTADQMRAYAAAEVAKAVAAERERRAKLVEQVAEIARLRSKVASLTLYENMAKEFGLSAFPDCAAWQKTLEAIADGRVMPREGQHSHAETVAAYQALARKALDSADHFGDTNKMVLGPSVGAKRALAQE
jgi:hypothetical protein